MEHILSETNMSSGIQEIYSIWWKPKVHYRKHKISPPALILTGLIQYMPRSHFMKGNFSIILSSILRSFKWPFSSRFHIKTLSPPLLSAKVLHAPPPSHLSWLEHPNNIWWGVQTKTPHYAVFSTPLLPRPS